MLLLILKLEIAIWHRSPHPMVRCARLTRIFGYGYTVRMYWNATLHVPQGRAIRPTDISDYIRHSTLPCRLVCTHQCRPIRSCSFPVSDQLDRTCFRE